MSSTSASSISSASASASSDWWCGSGQVKWLTDVVAGGKSNDWLMWWYGNALCLALVLALALTDDVVAVGKSNDWLMWWQGASQMIDPPATTSVSHLTCPLPPHQSVIWLALYHYITTLVSHLTCPHHHISQSFDLWCNDTVTLYV